MSDRPNLIICMCDELRAFEVGCYGHPHIETPNIDAMASRGTRFEHGVSNCPVCMPARSVVLSGEYARTCCGTLTNVGWPGGAGFKNVGFPQWPTGERVHLPDPTLPELLRDVGYDTMAVGKWHMEAWPDAVGFDHYMIPAHHHANVAQWFIEDGGMPHSHEGYAVEHELRRVERYLGERAASDDPFFLYYNISPPHMPLLEAPEKYLEMYGPDDVVHRPNIDWSKEPQWREWNYGSYLWDYRYYRDHLPYTRELPDGMDHTKLTALYMGLTTWVDDTVGSLLAAVEATGQAENTIVIFCADHGDNLGSHGRMGKGSLNEESIRVPMIGVGPGVANQTNGTQVASLLDLAPTLLGFAGQAVPEHMRGQDLSAVWRGEADRAERDYALIETVGDGLGVRTPTHTYGLPWTDDQSAGDAPHYFTDLREDPYQQEKLGCGDGQLRAQLDAVVRAFDAETRWKA